MPLRKILSAVILVFLAFSASLADDEITSIEQLNDSSRVIGLFDAGPCTDALKLHLPKANLQYFTGPDMYIAVKFGKVDAVAYDNSQMAMAIRDGLEGVKILPGSIGELFNGAGISRVSKIPGLKEKLNQFLEEAKKDGTISDMLERWVRKRDYKVPDIPEPSNPQFTLTVATTGLVMPFSFYEGNNLTGFDIELAKRFALWLGAGLEFKVYGFGGAYAALRGGDADCLLSNLQITKDRKGSIDFSDPIYVTKIVLLVRGKRDTDYSSDEFMPAVWSPSEPENDNSALIREYNGKNIAVGTGSIQAIQIPEILPESKITYLDTAANLNQALRTGKVDAVATDDAVAYAVERENEYFTHADGYLSTYENAFVFPKRMTERQKKIADEMNEYLRRIKSDGTLKQIHDIWFGNDESRKIIADYANLPGTNGTLHIAAENDTQPYTYVKNNMLVGYEVDIITRFCREKGYRPDFMIVNFSGLIPAVQSGKSDIGMCSITITPERQEAVTFSEPTYKGGTVLLIRKSDYHPSAKTEGTISESQSHSTKTSKTAETPESHSPSARSARIPKYKHISELDGKPIGMQPGVIDWEEWAAENLPHSKIQYYNTYPDLVSALKTHKIEGFLVDSPVLKLMAAEDKSLTAINEPVGEPFGYSFCYAKTDKGKKLCDEMSEYIRQIKASGELDALLSAWQGADESAKIPPDFKSLPAKNGTLTFAAEGSYPPFTYYKATKLAGIDLDIAVRFCRAYGYGLKVQTMLFDAMIPAINSGKIDFAGDFTPSEEHEEAVYFSEPYCDASSVMAVLADTSEPATNAESQTPAGYASLAGKRIGVQIGTTCAELVPERIPSAKVEYYNSLTDQLAALRAGKVEAVCCSLPAAIYTENEDPKLTRINPPLRETYLYPIFASTEKGRKLCDEYSAFLKTLWDNGTIDALNEKWLGADESKKTVDDYSQLPSENGKIIMAVDTSLVPFAYVKDNRIVGYDIDLAVRFCKAKGYSLEVQNMPLTGVIASVKAGKSDFMQSVNKTPERAENTLFTSTPAIKSGNVLLTVKTETPGAVPMYTDKSQLAGKKIGAMLGTLNPEIAKQNVPSAEIQQFDSMTDTLVALKAGKVDAICVPVPVARFMLLDNDDISYCGEQLTHYDLSPIFPKTDEGRKLCAQFSEFIKPLWEDGTIQQLDAKWFSKDDSKKVIDDYSHLPNPNGTLKMAVDLSIVPFVCVMNGKITGYDVDCAVRFCKAYGYGLEIIPMSFEAIIPALQSGKCDFAMSSFAYTEERAENVLFSYPNAKTGNVFLVKKTQAKETQPVSEEYTNISQLNGKRIGVTAGSIHDRLAKEKIPNAEIVYFNSNSDILPALMTGKIDAIACGESTALFMIREGHNITFLPQKLQRTNRKAAFAKTERGRELCKEYSDFLKTLWDNGTIAKLVYKWIDGEDDSKRVVEDYSNLPHPNGILTMAVDPSVTPYVYEKDQRVQGYEIDLAVMFCKAKGYGLNVEIMSHNGVLAFLETGKCDFSYGIDFTDEREKSLILSDVPNTDSANVIVVLKPRDSEAPAVNMNLSYFEGRKIGVITGTNNAIIVKGKIPSAKLVYYESPADMLLALKHGKIDAMSCGIATSVFVMKENPGLARVSEPLSKNYHSVTFTSSDKGLKLRDEYGEFLTALWKNGTIEKLFDDWIINNGKASNSENYSQLPAENGTLKMAADVSMLPFVYMKDNKIVGYDVELALMFCRAKGYGLEIVPSTHSGVLAAVASGKCDFSYSMEYTEERAKSVLFSEVPNIEADNVLVVMKPSEKIHPIHEPVSGSDEPSFWEDIALSFNKTFIREERWKLFSEGIMSTMIITVSAIFCGMLLGFTAFMFCRTGSKIANVITKFSVWLIKGTPIVVLLMILYYVIFGHVNISGIIVSIIAFTLTFGTAVYRMLTFGTGAVDRGQTEAAYALGFTDMQTFFTVILPQAALHFMPSFKEEVTALIKSTSVVGYIAVQDLTKMGDIVRSRTYEAFFPLIAVAVIYFILAGLLNIIVNIIHTRITPSKRKPEDILHGIDTERGNANHD